MSKTVEIKPTTRHEGHTNLLLEVDDDGIVENGYYQSVTPVRGFEKFLVGKIAEFAPIAVSRFCGVCPTAHSISSVEAIEDACNITPTKDGLILRELTGLGNKLQSHPLHQFLISPDFIPEKDKGVFIKRVQEMRKIGQYFVDTIGGEAIHPPNVVIGGMAKNITREAKNKLMNYASTYLKLAEEQCEYLLGIYESRKLVDGTEIPKELGYHNFPYLATHPTYGDRTKLDMRNVVETTPFDEYPKEIAKNACTNIPKVNGSLMEVGPRSRMAIFSGFKEKGTMGIHKARALESIVNINRVIELLDLLNIDGKVKSEDPIVGDGEKIGYGMIESPRGHNTHSVTITKDGRISYYSAIVATTWNIPVIGVATKGQHYKFAEHVVRGYDPCVSCATHMIVKDFNNNTIDSKIFR